MLVFGDGIGVVGYNHEYFDYLVNKNYQVPLDEVNNYIEGYAKKDYYLLEEIKELEPQIEESLRIIHSAKVKTK